MISFFYKKEDKLYNLLYNITKIYYTNKRKSPERRQYEL